jgi:hypothetical protein
VWLPNDIVEQVEAVARIHYVDVFATKLWNEHRRDGELRLLTGWAWVERNGRLHRQGFKTRTVAYRDAYYALILGDTAPHEARRVNVRSKAAQV